MKDKKEKKQPDASMYSPKQAMVVYATNPAQSNDRESKYYVEVSDIMQEANRAYIGAGKPVTRESLQMIMDVVARSDKQTYYSISDTIPSHLLIIDQRAGRNVIAWWKPAQRQTLLMRGKPSITAWTPPLVFIVKNKELCVGALTKNSRPTVTTRLSHAPFFNVYNDMHVCLGNVKPPQISGDIRELINEWEKAFWNSEFTDTVTGAYKKKDLELWWRKKRRGKFNLKKLKQSNANLKMLCER
jgi:PRTRC genetic system protein B